MVNIAIVGTGYVGLPQGAVFADAGNKVICVDCSEERIKHIIDFCENRRENLPLYEKGINELVKRNYMNGLLEFTTDTQSAVNRSDVLFICVGTPSDEAGYVDRKYVFDAAEDIARAMNIKKGYKVVVIKSTVIPGTAAMVKERMSNITGAELDVISNPEFLAQGEATSDALKPSRVILGLPKEKFNKLGGEVLEKLFRNIYNPFTHGNPQKIYFMTNEDAEIHKYAANTNLAVQIVTNNEIARLCRVTGANWRRVRQGLKHDPRIGSFTHPSPGFGGSCFPKDVKALASLFKEQGVVSEVISKIIPSNEYQKLTLNRRLEKHFGIGAGDTYGIWGLSFKAKTNDTRESAAIEIIVDLLKRGVNVKVYDPEGALDMKERLAGMEDIAPLLKNVEFFYPYKGDSKYDLIPDIDGLFVLTEWNEFRQPDFHELKTKMKRPLILDGRDLYNPEQMQGLGFNYICIGNPDVIQS